MSLAYSAVVSWVPEFYKGQPVTMNSVTGHLINPKTEKMIVIKVPLAK